MRPPRVHIRSIRAKLLRRSLLGEAGDHKTVFAHFAVGPGRRIGLSPNEGGELRHDSRHALRTGQIYALHAGTHDSQSGGAIASLMILVTSSGCEPLVSSMDL